MLIGKTSKKSANKNIEKDIHPVIIKTFLELNLDIIFSSYNNKISARMFELVFASYFAFSDNLLPNRSIIKTIPPYVNPNRKTLMS